MALPLTYDQRLQILNQLEEQLEAHVKSQLTRLQREREFLELVRDTQTISATVRRSAHHDQIKAVAYTRLFTG